MKNECKQKIALLIQEKIHTKLSNYQAETTYTPFFSAIFDEDVIVKASLMQSLYTSFGMSIYEQMAIILASEAGYNASRQYKIQGEIDKETSSLIDDLCNNSTPNKKIEIEAIRKSIKPAKQIKSIDKESVVDVFVKYKDGSELFVDITTVKPNLKEFRALGKKLLRWVALRLSVDKDTVVDTRIGIPYNPYYPEDYRRWTGNECSSDDLLIQNELWQAFAGYDVFDEIINVFKDVGFDLKSEIKKFMENK